MKHIVRLFSILTLLLSGNSLMAQRYLSEVFTTVTKTSNVEYAQNMTVITGTPGMDTLKMDVYEPTGDTMAIRPVILLSHTGSFLPSPQNGQATGSRTDSAIVELCNGFAMRGYVAIAYTYRKGWNPVSPTQEVRTGTLLNAAYRGIQDTRSLVRFLRKDVATGTNTYNVDTSRIIVGGLGTGGYIALGVASLDKYAEIALAKFIDPGTSMSFVDTSLSGDWYGMNTRPLNIENHVGYSSDVHMVFNLGGAIGDSTWLEAGDPPMVGFHVPSDPFAPYNYGPVIVPTTGNFVVNVSGTGDILKTANRLGNQSVFNGIPWSDPFTTAANAVNGGVEGLYPFIRPTVEASPWEWWDSLYWGLVAHPSGGTFHSQGLLTNPDMSDVKGRTYIDTVQGYLNPRIVCALNLPGCPGTINVSSREQMQVSLYPNPATDRFVVQSGDRIQHIKICDITGRVMLHEQNINNNVISLSTDNLAPGLYLVEIVGEKGKATRKLRVD